MECITVEMVLEKHEKVTKSCVYRSPDSCIDSFNNKMLELFGTGKINDSRFVCGDFNIDLMMVDKCKTNRDFINSMYCLGLFPTIVKRSKIPIQSATIIHNIFTNISGKTITSGLMIKDISDHSSL